MYSYVNRRKVAGLLQLFRSTTICNIFGNIIHHQETFTPNESFRQAGVSLGSVASGSFFSHYFDIPDIDIEIAKQQNGSCDGLLLRIESVAATGMDLARAASGESQPTTS